MKKNFFFFFFFLFDIQNIDKNANYKKRVIYLQSDRKIDFKFTKNN